MYKFILLINLSISQYTKIWQLHVQHPFWRKRLNYRFHEVLNKEISVLNIPEVKNSVFWCPTGITRLLRIRDHFFSLLTRNPKVAAFIWHKTLQLFYEQFVTAFIWRKKPKATELHMCNLDSILMTMSFDVKMMQNHKDIRICLVLINLIIKDPDLW